MRSAPRLPLAIATALALSVGLSAPALAGGGRVNHEAPGHQVYASPHGTPIALTPDGSKLFVVNTENNLVEVVDATTQVLLRRIDVGIDPVSVAVRPDGNEVWVSNHVSDSVSVIDTNPASASYLRVVETVQSVDANGVTQFDEPVGIAFKADGSQAYVALSSRNQVALVDTATYAVTGFLDIRAQEPRALRVHGGRLYVAAFESSNQSELSICEQTDGTAQCTLETGDLGTFAVNPNLPGLDKNIVIDPDVPDRDVFVFDLSSNPPQEKDVVSGVGTLLYGMTASGTNVFVTQADARNADNGLEGQNLIDLQNRMFFNRIAVIDCSGNNNNPCSTVTQIELDAPVGTSPAPGTQLATPFGIEASGDGSTLVGVAAGSSRLFTLDPATGSVLGRVDVGAIPRGVALRSDGSGAPQTAYVFNALDPSVTVVDVSTPSAPAVVATLPLLDDPTPTAVRLGRIAFNDANASTEGTFSCASCHPDGNTDQLLWRIGGACFLGACTGDDEPRSTMPIRGLRDTLPLHWDGTLGDPIGGPNGAVGVAGNVAPNCAANDPHSCFRQLVDASLSGVMCDQAGGCATGPSGLPGALTAQQRDDMATFLESVSYPPARSRRIDDSLSTAAVNGFEDFFFDQGSIFGGAITNPDTCADSNAGCHELPLGAGTNSETLQGFDAPTMRGLTDRYLQFSLGITAAEEVMVDANDGATINVLGFPLTAPPNPAPWDPNEGYEELTTFGVAFAIFDPVYNVGPLDIFQMFEEASTGHSGAIGRQVQLNTGTAGLPETDATLAQLEAADANGLVNLRGSGVRNGSPVTISYKADLGKYQVGGAQLSRSFVLSQAQTGALLATLTAHLRADVTPATPQPLVAPPGANCDAGRGATGDPSLPVLGGGATTMDLESKYVGATDAVFVDGAPVPSATITLLGGSTVCSADAIPTDPIRVDLGTSLSSGTHLLQIRTDAGLLSNELPFEVK